MVKGYLLLFLIFLGVFYREYSRESDIITVANFGTTEKVPIIKKSENCGSSTRFHNRIEIKTKESKVFSLSITDEECERIRLNDSILVRYLKDHDYVMRVYDYEIPVRKRGYLAYLCLLIAIMSVIAMVRIYVKKT